MCLQVWHHINTPFVVRIVEKAFRLDWRAFRRAIVIQVLYKVKNSDKGDKGNTVPGIFIGSI